MLDMHTETIVLNDSARSEFDQIFAEHSPEHRDTIWEARPDELKYQEVPVDVLRAMSADIRDKEEFLSMLTGKDIEDIEAGR